MAPLSTPLSTTATFRDAPLFDADLAEVDAAIREAVTGKRILAVGAAGSIGSSTVKRLSAYDPAAIHVVDHNENALAELVRELRSGTEDFTVGEFRTLPLDYGSPAMLQLMEAEGPYDRILNFAAIKHVRSEKDVFSILQMFDTNIVKQARFRDWIARTSPDADYFSVSTDKAANPVSFMGASKRVMEHVLFHGAREAGLNGTVSTTRFANVAYSNGSLLQGWENRLRRREPLPCPDGIQRYFVSLHEAGQICLLASTVAGHERIAIPRLDPATQLVPLERVARRFLAHHGLEPLVVRDEAEARHGVEAALADGKYPLLLTPANTAGEKPYEEFVGEGETSVEIGLPNMLAVPYRGLADGANFAAFMAEIEALVLGGRPVSGLDKDALRDLLASVEPQFAAAHIASRETLDDRV